MRMTTIHAQAERKRQDRSVCRAEKRLCRARMLRVRGLIHPTSAVCATTDTAQGEKCLFSWQNQAILTSDGRPLGECRVIQTKANVAWPNKVCQIIDMTDQAFDADIIIPDEYSHSGQADHTPCPSAGNDLRIR